MFENFPYTNFHDLNLDWLIQKIMEAYSPDNPPPLGLVLSVNGETGAVVLYRDQNVQLPDIDETSWNFFRLSDGTAEGIKFTKGGPAERIDGSQRYQIYDTGNPPPSSTPPVSSVDGMTGAVKTWANSNWQTITVPADAPANIWDLRRGLSNGDKVGIEFEYDSVNTVYKCYLKYTPSGGSPVRAELLTTANIPQSGVISVNTKTGIVTITGEDIAVDSNSQDSIATALSNLNTAIGNKYTKPAGGIPASDLAQGVIPDISGKQDAPATAGTAGQVLGLNNSLNPVWVNPPSISGLQPAPAVPGTSGQVLSLDNSLNPVWTNPGGLAGDAFLIKNYVSDSKTVTALIGSYYEMSDFPTLQLISGYYPIAVTDLTHSDAGIVTRGFNLGAVLAGSGQVVYVRNVTSTDRSNFVTLSILWIKSQYVTDQRS